MKVVFFARLFYPHIGGVEKHLMEVSKRLIKKGHRVTVITERYEDLPLKEIANGIEILRIDVGDKTSKLILWKNLLKYYSILKSADIIHCHDIFFWYLPFRFIFPLKKVYTTFHGYEGNSLPTQKAILMHKIAEKLSHGNICIGDYLKKWYGTKPNIVSYGAVNIPKQYPTGDIPKKIQNILYIGRLEAEAGIIEYLETLNLLKRKGIELKLTVLGDGSQRKDAEKYVKKNKLLVNFKGFVKDTSVYLPKADVVFSSRYLGILESFVFKKLVFVVYNNAIKKDCFFLSPFKNFIILENKPALLVNQFIKITNSPKNIKKLVDEEYEWIKKQTWDKLTNQYIRLWSESA